MGEAVSRHQSWPAGASAGEVAGNAGTAGGGHVIAFGWFDGVASVFGSVERLQDPKKRSFAMNVPLTFEFCVMSLQSPPAAIWMSMVSGIAGGPAGAVLSSWTRYHGLLPMIFSTF